MKAGNDEIAASVAAGTGGDWTDAEMVEGYLDGFNADIPEPSANRSRSYRHGFRNGRDDLMRKPSWSSLQAARDAAHLAQGEDREQ